VGVFSWCSCCWLQILHRTSPLFAPPPLSEKSGGKGGVDETTATYKRGCVRSIAGVSLRAGGGRGTRVNVALITHHSALSSSSVKCFLLILPHPLFSVLRGKDEKLNSPPPLALPTFTHVRCTTRVQQPRREALASRVEVRRSLQNPRAQRCGAALKNE
jgi:hypothetical protein